MKSYIIKTSLVIILLCSLAFTFTSNSQNLGCIDSISFNQFFPSNFQVPSLAGATFTYNPQRDVFDNVYLSGGTDNGGPNKYWSIIKFNAANQLVWYKNYKVDFLSVFKTGGDIHDIEPNGNLLFSGGTSTPYKQIISKADTVGNLLWSKIIQHGTNPIVNGGFSKPVMDINGELFSSGSFADDYNKVLIMALDAAGNLKWTKKYQHVTVPKFHLMGTVITSQNSSTLVLAVQYYYNADIETDPAAKLGLQLVKINKADGAVMQQTSFMYYNDVPGNIPNRAQLMKIKYSATIKSFILDFDESGFGISNRMFTLLDDDLNLVKTTYFSSAPKIVSSLIKINIGSNNEITMSATIQSGTPKWLLYTAIDNNLNIITQRAIDLTTIGFPNRNFDADLAYKKNGILNFQLATYTTFLQDYLYLFDHSPFYNNISTCLGKDSVIYNPVPMYVYPVANPTIEEAGAVPLQITNQFPDFPPVEFPLPKTELCKSISICDNIKLFGTTYHCLSNPFDSFKITRNPLCKRVTNWQVDTNYIKILAKTDTTLFVQYLQSYRGSIKVGFGGCSLTDEIPIEVYAPKTGINLGNDTMHCPGKTITLHAGPGFKTYRWQDGKIFESYTATGPGTYHVTATDSCGNVFKDTLVIKPSDVALKVDYPQEFCLYDTATFILPNKLYNYTWQPTTATTLINNRWQLFPSSTTVYSISGERMPGCILSDTVLITVKNCPIYIYFPTAFTPNNDGLNDTYKPNVSGRLQFYEFAIYNRWGQQVFKSNIPNQGWDGRIKEDQPTISSYIWTCRYQFINAPLINKKGMFTLVR